MLQGARSGPAAGLQGQRRRPDGRGRPESQACALAQGRACSPPGPSDRCDDQPADQALLSTRTAQPADGRRVGLVLQHVRSSTLSFARSLQCGSIVPCSQRISGLHSLVCLLILALACFKLLTCCLHNPLVYSLPQSLTLNAARSSSRPSLRYRKCFYSYALPCTLGVHSPDGITGHLKNVKNT